MTADYTTGCDDSQSWSYQDLDKDKWSILGMRKIVCCIVIVFSKQHASKTGGFYGSISATT